MFKYPYTNEHEMNLDWIISKVQEIAEELKDFEAINAITFSGSWDITKQYPAWTIVSDNNIGYVSIKPVPVGITLDNGNYWRTMIDYTAQIAGLQSRVVDVENDLASQQTAINALNNLYVDNVQNSLKGNWLFLGDSYDTTSGSWIDSVAGYLGITDRYENLAVSGHGFASGTWLSDITSWVSSHPDDVNKIYHIVVGGGLNDASDANLPNVYTSIQAFMNYVKSNLPNAEVMIAYMGNALADSAYLNTRTAENRAKCIYEYVNACGTTGAIYLNNIEYVLHSYSLFISDGVHPNASGISRLAIAVSAAIKGSYTKTEILFENTPSFQSGIMACAYIESAVNNGVSTLRMNKVRCTDTTNTFNFTGGNFVDLGRIPSKAQQYNLPEIPITLLAANVSTSYPYIATARVRNGHLEVAVTDQSNMTTYKSFNANGNAFYLGNLVWSVNTLLDC